MRTIDRLESRVRSYCRSFPTEFTTARGARLTDRKGRSYLDFFAGAGALNYGHNDPDLRAALVQYISGEGVTHSLDMTTSAKIEFLEELERTVLAPREMDYRVMFPGPTGTNAVEAALKLARKITGRTEVVSFTNAFHGMTLGSLAATGNQFKRDGAGVPLHHVVQVPFDGYHGPEFDTAEHLERVLSDSSSGTDRPAAVILETIQAEGGIHTASAEWVRRIADSARRHGALLVVDDIQVGCGRTGTFFSFEEMGIEPDLVCLSKSLSGFGLPLAVVLIRPELDVWEPGEHNGTFRGNNHAFVTAAAALRKFWRTSEFEEAVSEKADCLGGILKGMAREFDLEHRGRGLIQGLVFPEPGRAADVSARAFERGVIVETAGAEDEVVKILPPLTIDRDSLLEGLDVIRRAILAERGGGGSNGSRPAPSEVAAEVGAES
jgi:diaminobutyrate-2-oxoglutarate transaminase